MEKIRAAHNNQLLVFLILGILIRILVFFVMEPSNPDGHYEIIEHIYKFREIPKSDRYGMAFHPPLYYVLSLPFWHAGGLKCVQLFSLLLSIGTLFIVYFFINNHKTFELNSKILLFAITSFLPSLVTFTLYVSNDSLAIFLGALYFYIASTFLENINYRKVLFLSIILGLGLLTKGTFLVFFVFTIGYIYSSASPFSQKNKYVMIVLIISLTIGSYKYIKNFLDFHMVFIHNLDFNPVWADYQRPTVTGIKSFIDIDILKLINSPCISNSSRHSIPLLFYSSFWYKQHYLVNNLATSSTPLRYIGSVIYILGILPTSFIVIGVLDCIKRIIKNFKATYTETDVATLLECLTLMVFFLVLYLGVKYDIWSAFQSRLLYPAFIGILLFMNDGYIKVIKYISGKWIKTLINVLIIILIFYYSIEIPLTFIMTM